MLLRETPADSSLVRLGAGGEQVVASIPARSRGGGRVVVEGTTAVVTVDRPDRTVFVSVDLATGEVVPLPPVPGEGILWLGRCRPHAGGVLTAILRHPEPPALWRYDGRSWEAVALPPGLDAWDVAVDGATTALAGATSERRGTRACVMVRQGDGPWEVAYAAPRGRRLPDVASFDRLAGVGGLLVAAGTTSQLAPIDGLIVVGAPGGEWRSERLRDELWIGLVRAGSGTVAVTSYGRTVPVTGEAALPGLGEALRSLPGDDVFLRCVRGGPDVFVAIAHALTDHQRTGSRVLLSVDGGETFDVVHESSPDGPHLVDVGLSPQPSCATMEPRA